MSTKMLEEEEDQSSLSEKADSDRMHELHLSNLSKK